MAQTIPSFPLSAIDNLVSDISELIDEHQLGDETLDNAPMFKGAWTIGVRIEQDCSSYSASKLTQLFSAVGKRLKEACGREFGPTYLRKCLNLARSFPDIAGLRAELDWKQYEEIYRIKDLKRRQEITNAAAEGAWEPSRIRLHREYQGLDTLPSYSRCWHLEASQTILRFIQAYVDACGIIEVEALHDLLKQENPGITFSYDFKEAIWCLADKRSEDYRPLIWRGEQGFHLVAQELSNSTALNTYHFSDYQYSYACYERHTDFIQEVREKQALKLETRRATILAGHKEWPIKQLDSHTIECGFHPCERQIEHLKEAVFKEAESDSRELYYRQEGFDFAIAKLIRYVGLAGMASASEIDDDVAFLLVCSGFPYAENPQRGMIKNLLEPLYTQLPLWEFNGHSYAEITARKA